MNKVDRLEQVYRESERAFVADPSDETMQAMTDAEQAWIDAEEIAAGGTPGFMVIQSW
jgi:hypothetical protein